MQTELLRRHGVMEGKGAYNRHAQIPRRFGFWRLPPLEEAVRRASNSTAREQHVVLADYGSSQGKNSLAPMHSRLAFFGNGLALSGRSLYSTSISPRTTSTRYSKCWLQTLTDMPSTSRMYIRVLSEGPSMRTAPA